MSNLGWRLRAAGMLGLAAAVLGAAGCGEDALTGEPGNPAEIAEMNIDLALEDGGMSAADEMPYFGDPYFATYLGDDREVDVVGDPLATDERLQQVESDPDVEVKFVRVVWGNMTRGPEADDTQADAAAIDWTGGAGVSDGILMPLRTIRFERNDYLIPPWRQDDPSRNRLQWVSHTRGGKDGVLLKIVVPAGGDDTMSGALAGNGDGLTEDDRFVFRTGPLTVEFPIAKLQDLDELIMVDDVNGVSFVGFDREDLDDLCPRGTLEGAWVRVENDTRFGGFFRAKWVGPLGRVLGHVRGRWGVLPEGEKVFVGKIIGRNGEYLGHIRGNWQPSDDDPRHGAFLGRWVIRRGTDAEVKGALRGAWAVSRRVADGGFLRGIWAAHCNRDGQGLTRDGGA